MKLKHQIYIVLFFVLGFFACGTHTEEEEHEHTHSHEDGGHHEEEKEHGDEVHFSELQFNTLEMKVDTLPMRNINAYVIANGELEAPPQNEALVTTMIGANVKSIQVIEGDKIRKGQVLAYLTHPDLITLQAEYVNDWHQLKYLKQAYERHKKLLEEKVGAGKDLQKMEADYRAMEAKVTGHAAQLRLLGFNIDKIQQNKFYQQMAITSPINGYVRLVEVKTGQFVNPQMPMFEIVNLEHIHIDLMVFEKDVYKVRERQKVIFTTESIPNKEMEAKVYAVGKAFEDGPKAIHLHAEIENKEGMLIPGMYVQGRILTGDVKSTALPEEGVVRDGDKYYVFIAEKHDEEGNTEWAFKPVEVKLGQKDKGWVEVKLLTSMDGQTVAWNNAYYLMAEMKKSEAEHSH